jgi:guanosine-3',5'-bis(diphosphate) 3'-pyrophosphohydrolase
MIEAKELIRLVKVYNPKTNHKLINKAFEYSRTMHTGQSRRSGGLMGNTCPQKKPKFQ